MRIVTGIVLGCAGNILLFMLAGLIFLVTHPPGDLGISPISSVDIPDSQYVVRVYPPNSNGQYQYVIFGDNSRVSYGSNNLGPGKVDELFEPTILDVSPGIYQINWGERKEAAYTIIDVKRGLIIEDSNPDTQTNYPFVDKP